MIAKCASSDIAGSEHSYFVVFIVFVVLVFVSVVVIVVSFIIEHFVLTRRGYDGIRQHRMMVHTRKGKSREVKKRKERRCTYARTYLSCSIVSPALGNVIRFRAGGIYVYMFICLYVYVFICLEEGNVSMIGYVLC